MKATLRVLCARHLQDPVDAPEAWYSSLFRTQTFGVQTVPLWKELRCAIDGKLMAAALLCHLVMSNQSKI